MITEDQLLAIKKRYSQISVLDFDNLDIVAAHGKLGEEVSEQVWRILHRKLKTLKHKDLVKQIRLARNCQTAIQNRSSSSILERKIQTAFKEYMACLSAWAKGVGIDNSAQALVGDIIVDGNPISMCDLALMLQNDNSGCQTGAYRANDDSVIMWHTEEDVEDSPGSRFDKLRLISLNMGEAPYSKKVTAFVYPDLLPGPAFGWCGNSFIQTVDALYLKPSFGAGGILANIASWMSLYFANEIETEKLIQSLGPFIDGYALTTIKRNPRKICATKVEFVADKLVHTSLDSIAGSFFFQVNVLSDKNGPLALYEEIDNLRREPFEMRIERTERFIRNLSPFDNTFLSIWKLLSSQAGDDFAYANESVKSYFVSAINQEGIEIWLGLGPAMNKDEPIVFIMRE